MHFPLAQVICDHQVRHHRSCDYVNRRVLVFFCTPHPRNRTHVPSLDVWNVSKVSWCIFALRNEEIL